MRNCRMLLNCVAYQQGTKLADIAVPEIAEYLARRASDPEVEEYTGLIRDEVHRIATKPRKAATRIAPAPATPLSSPSTWQRSPYYRSAPRPTSINILPAALAQSAVASSEPSSTTQTGQPVALAAPTTRVMVSASL